MIPDFIPTGPFVHALMPVHVSKHRQFDRDGKKTVGKCIIMENSSIKKRMRAARRKA